MVTILLTVVPSFVMAGHISWTDWTSVTSTTASGTVQATSVVYSGAPLTGGETVLNGTFFWSGLAAFLVEVPSPADLIATSGGVVTHTLTFGSTINTPVYINFYSIGRDDTTIDLDFGTTDFDVIASNNGQLPARIFTEIVSGSNHTLRGREGTGSIRILGPLSSISWTTNASEYYMGFTPGVENPIPEPSTIVLFGVGILGILGYSYRRRKAAK